MGIGMVGNVAVAIIVLGDAAGFEVCVGSLTFPVHPIVINIRINVVNIHLDW
jgi:hypothetical protein